MKLGNHRRVQKKLFIWIAVLLFLEWFSFRNMYGTEALFGDLGDGRLTMLLSEHWYRFFRGEEAFADTGFFFPAENTLAYSDLFLGFGVIHSFLRFLNLDMYFAFKYTVLLIHLTGTLLCFYLLYKVLGLKSVWAVFGTVAFSFSDSFVTGLLHTQLASLSLLPAVTIPGIRFFQSLQYRKKRNCYAYATILLMAVILYTAWYTAFFIVFFLFSWMIVGFFFLLINRSGIIESLRKFFLLLKWDLVGYLIFGIGLILPFILLELPVMRMSGGYDYEEIRRNYLPGLAGLIHVSAGNLLLGSVEVSLPWFAGKNHEIIRGFSIVLLAVFAYTVIDLLIRTFRSHGNKEARERSKNLICGILAATVILNILLMIRWPGNGFSLWSLVFRFFPGGKSIRAVGRYMLFLSFPLSMLTAYMAGTGGKKISKELLIGIPNLRTGNVVACLLLCLLEVSNINMVTINAEGVISPWNRADAVQRMNQIADPPDDCRVFYLSAPSDPETILPLLQTEACEIAAAKSLKSINGYSGNMPEDWGGIWDIRGDQYEESVLDWIEKYHIEDVYQYNQTDNAWYKVYIETE